MTPLDLEDAGRDLIEEVPVVRDDDQRAAVAFQIALQPLEHADVQMVRRLVQQQDIRFLQQQGSHGQARAFSAGERADRLVEIVVRERQAAQDAAQALVVGISVALFKRGFLLVRRGFRDLFSHGASVWEVIPLLQIAEACAALEVQFTAVGGQFACKDAHQRALARAVRADDADAVARVHVERDVFQHGLDPEALIQFGRCDDAHNQIILP